MKRSKEKDLLRYTLFSKSPLQQTFHNRDVAVNTDFLESSNNFTIDEFRVRNADSQLETRGATIRVTINPKFMVETNRCWYLGPFGSRVSRRVTRRTTLYRRIRLTNMRDCS